MLFATALLTISGSVAPRCPVPPRPAAAVVAISVTAMPVEAALDTSANPPKRSASGATLVGEVQYDWGFSLRSDDPRFRDFDMSPGALHSRSSDCWFVWDYHRGERGIDGILNPRIGASLYRPGFAPPRPSVTPVVPGYRFVAADRTYSSEYGWVGLWADEGARGRTELIAFGDHGSHVLASFPFRLAAVATTPSPDTPALAITMAGEGRPGEAVPYLQVVWKAR